MVTIVAEDLSKMKIDTRPGPFGFGKMLLLTVLVMAWLLSSAAHAEGNNPGLPASRPNMILIMIDNTGFAEIGVNGNDLVKTPHLDRFARQGVQLTRFLSNPMCAPTRASLMTGRYHYRTGVIHTSRGGAKMHGDEVTIAERLKEIGYTTGLFGKWHLGDNYPMRPQDQGFDEVLTFKSGRLGQVPDKPNPYIDPRLWQNGQWVQKRGYCSDLFTAAAIEFIQKHRNRRFFVYLPYNIAHASNEVGEQVPPNYTADYLAKGIKPKIATVCGMLDNLDENFGRLIAQLDSLKLRDNTLIIFCSDDGNVRINRGTLRGQGYATLYEGSLKVPFFAQWPGHFPSGLKTNRLASHIDIVPTLLAVADTTSSPLPAVDGVSLLPLLEGNAAPWTDRMLFLQCHRGMTPQRYQNCAVVTERFKLIFYPETFNNRQLKASPDQPVMQLCDLAADPHESTNVATEHPEVVARLRAAYDRWFDEVQSERQFAPGRIHLGSEAENPTLLSRYQDATYVDQKPTGWPVVIEQEGRYELTIRRGKSLGKGRLVVQLDDMRMTQPLGKGENRAVFFLPAGKAHLNAWIEEQGKPYIPRPDEDVIGDVEVCRVATR
jgi:arylsulfatase A-like enzyme